MTVASNGLAFGEPNCIRFNFLKWSLHSRLNFHSKDVGKLNEFKGQQVLARGLSETEAFSLETRLIETAQSSGRRILNKRVSTRNPIANIPRVTDPSVTHLPKNYFEQGN